MESNDNSNGSLIDLEALDNLFGGDTGFRNALLAKMHVQIPEIMAQIAEEFETKNYDALGKSAHKLKSTITYLGVGEFKDVLQEIESTCKSGNRLESVPGSVARAEELSELVMTELSGMI